MKQRGPINRHRKLGAKQLPARFRRLRDAEARELEKPGQSANESQDSDDPWDFSESRLEFEYLYPLLQRNRAFQRLIGKGTCGLPVLPSSFAARYSGDGSGEVEAESPKPAWARRHSNPAELIDFLANNVIANRGWGLPSDQISNPSFGEPDEIAAFRELARLHATADKQHRQAAALLAMHLLSRFWIRSVRDWPQEKLADDDWIDSLAAHLFVEFPIPSFLQGCWRMEHSWEEPDSKRIAWYVLLGQGVSLTKAASACNWVIPNRLVHWLYKAPKELGMTEAIVWAEVMRLGGTQTEYRRLRRQRALAIDLTDSPLHYRPYRDFLKHAVPWLVRNREELTDLTCDVILDWLVHLFTEGVDGIVRPLPWRLSARRALEQAAAYARTRELPYAECSWSKSGWDWTLTAADGTQWTVQELTTGRELFEEGRNLRHCVGSYASRCVMGGSAIFSVRANGQRCLTLEVVPVSRDVVQARGESNRLPTRAEQEILARWCQEMLHAK